MAKVKLTDEMLLRAYWIREFRKRHYKTAKVAAYGLPATPSQWTNWENASNEPHPSTLQKLADYLGVTVEDFSKEPENWHEERKKFLASLRRRSRKNKERYDIPPPSSGSEQSGAMERMDESDIFLEIASLVNDAHRKVKQGKIPNATYNRNMKFLTELIELATAHT